MLQASLSPAAISSGVVRDISRQPLEASIERRVEVSLPSGAAKEGGLHEVVAKDLATEWWSSPGGRAAGACSMKGRTRRMALWPQ